MRPGPTFAFLPLQGSSRLRWRNVVAGIGGLIWTACAPIPAPALEASPLPPASETPAADVPSPVPAESQTPSPLTEETPAIVLEPPFLVLTATPVLVHAPLPLEKLSLILPGPGSQVTSPFQVIGRGGPSWNQRVRLRLLGEDGSEITRITSYILALPESSGRFVADVSFSLEGVAEAARLEVSTDSLRTGRLAHLASVDLILLSVGRPLIHPGSEGPEKLAIFSPREGVRVSGGRVLVRGAGWVDSQVPLHIEILDRFGAAVGAAEVLLNAPEVGQVGTFEVEVHYSVPSGQFGRIAVFELGTTLPGTVHYTSIEVYLEP